MRCETMFALARPRSASDRGQALCESSACCGCRCRRHHGQRRSQGRARQWHGVAYVHARGDVAPTQMEQKAMELLKDRFGLNAFRDGQLDVILRVMKGESALGVFPTGMGKSLCFQLPALHFAGLTLVVSPLIALMKDQVGSLQALGIAAASLDSTLDTESAAQVQSDVRNNRIKILFVAPERLKNESFRRMIDHIHVSMMVVDEAHCISEWGHSFRPVYLLVAAFAQEIQNPVVLALTATATPAVVKDICREFRIEQECNALVHRAYRSNLELRASRVSPHTPLIDRVRSLAACIGTRSRGSTIVYVTLQETASKVAALLCDHGLPAQAYHAGMSSDERAEVQESFLSSPDGIIVATIAFGMGIDKPDIRFVYHFNMAKCIESFCQEVGRAGRDGVQATCESFVSAEDVQTLESMIIGDTPDLSSIVDLLTIFFDRNNARAELQELVSGTDNRLLIDLFGLGSFVDMNDSPLKVTLALVEKAGYITELTPLYMYHEIDPEGDHSMDDILNALGTQGSSGKERAIFEKIIEASKRGTRRSPKTPFYKFEVTEEFMSVNAELIPGHSLEDKSRMLSRVINSYPNLYRTKPGKLRHVYRVNRRLEGREFDLLCDQFYRRLVERERTEIQRLSNLQSMLLGHAGCFSRYIDDYFGSESPITRCGHCEFCITGSAESNAVTTQAPTLRSDPLEDPEFVDLVHVCQNELGLTSARQVARFAWAVKSPALRKHQRSALWGSLRFKYAFKPLLEAANQLVQPPQPPQLPEPQSKQQPRKQRDQT
ncbi:ATP-dependent DNA helicase RecQ [Porphyridium purpureum]|uniref:DNA 3'-5' helicase n=1 Tax=Porphyridium purpureum TaxID=35688 RepID=A0A5J4Z1S3_PORPP|nr:ATP-dependent DNA helicase RecQ [Porphyridium purpureum]|eukprot:POR9747..scf295_1